MCTYSGIQYDGLKYNTQEINRNFKIKVSGVSGSKKVHKLVGVSGLIKLVGSDLANDIIDKAFSKGLDKYERKLRRGLKITFYTY